MSASPSDRASTFEAAFRQHVGAVRAYALRRTGPDDAADVVAEAFTVAWRRWDDAPDEPLPWLLGIARKVLANARRSSSRARALTARAGAERAPAPPPTPAEAVTEADAVRAALRRLPDGDRETLMLVAWDGLTPEAAARAAGCSRPTFAVRLHRARRRLAAELEALDALPALPAPEVLA